MTQSEAFEAVQRMVQEATAGREPARGMTREMMERAVQYAAVNRVPYETARMFALAGVDGRPVGGNPAGMTQAQMEAAVQYAATSKVPWDQARLWALANAR